jgi:hypothetical protein
MCNTYCFSTENVVARKRLYVTLYIHYVSCLQLLRISTVNIVPSMLHTLLYPHVCLIRRTNNKAWKSSKKQCSFGKRGALYIKVLWSLEVLQASCPTLHDAAFKRGHLAENMDMELYLLKLILPRETRELGVNELNCYCETPLQFSRKLQDNRNILA